MFSPVSGAVLITLHALFRPLRSMRKLFIGLGLSAFAAVTVSANNLPPDVTAYRVQFAPKYEVPGPVIGWTTYQGHYHFTGDYVVETDPYDASSDRIDTRFIVRRAIGHQKLYALGRGWGAEVQADNQVFSDGALLALRLRAAPDAPAHLSIHDLATGRRLFRLRHPRSDAPFGDDFGRNVWFTRDRILVAAPGHDEPENSGAIFIYDRESGALVRSVSPGVGGAYFGNLPHIPRSVDYFQSSKNNALIFHDNRLYRLVEDQLYTLDLPPSGKNTASVSQAFIANDRIVVITYEQNAKGHYAPGRGLVFNVADGKLAYQLKKRDGSRLSPSKIIARKGELYVYDSDADSGESGRGAIQVHDLATGQLLRRGIVPAAVNTTAHPHSLTVSQGLLWLLSYHPNIGAPSDTIWRAYDAETFEKRFELSPPGSDRFAGPAPRALGGGRFGVAATRDEPNDVIISPFSAAEPLSLWVVNPGMTVRTFGVLVYSSTHDKWTHRLRLGRPISDEFGQAYPSIAVFPDGSKTRSFATVDDSPVKIYRFDTVLPRPEPTLTWEARLSYTPAFGFAYDLLRRAPGMDDFALHGTVPFGDGTTRRDVLPYSDISDRVSYRLDGVQFSRHITAPEGEPLMTANTAPTSVVSRGEKIAMRLPATPTAQANVTIFNTTTGQIELVVESSGSGQVAFNDSHLAVGRATATSIQLFNATTGQFVRTLHNGPGFGSHIALSGNCLAATWTHSTYNGGIYTLTARLTVYDLPSGTVRYTKDLFARTTTQSGQTINQALVVSGDHLAVRVGPDRVNVFDLSSGTLLHELTSPAPSPNEYYGAWLAAEGDWLAIGASGTCEVFIYDLASGELQHTLILVDRPDGVPNYSSPFNRLAIDGENNLLTWFTPASWSGDRPILPAVYIFDLTTGLEVAKVLTPQTSPLTPPLLEGATLHKGTVYALTTNRKLVAYPLLETIAAPPISTSEMLTPVPVARLEFPTQSRVSYQPQYSSDEGTTWHSVGNTAHGNGRRISVRLAFPMETQPDSLIFRLRPKWELAPPPTTFPFAE